MTDWENLSAVLTDVEFEIEPLVDLQFFDELRGKQ